MITWSSGDTIVRSPIEAWPVTIVAPDSADGNGDSALVTSGLSLGALRLDLTGSQTAH